MCLRALFPIGITILSLLLMTSTDQSLGRELPANRSPIRFERFTIGPAPSYHPRITNVQVVDFDRDGIQDVIVCDAQTNRVLWYRQAPRGRWEERVLGKDLLVPAHATVVDLDQDGDQDVIVSILGNIFPDDTHVGRVVWLENEGERFVPRVLLDDVRRVADAQAGDLDGDGDLDLAVAVFGYAHGQVLWLENRGNRQFREHHLLAAIGAIHVPLADYDGDGDLDIASVATQDEEEVWGLENLGAGKFQPRRVYFNVNYDIGIGGLIRTDLDSDGDPDLLLPVGDNFEDRFCFPKPYDGCLWLENRGDWKFRAERIATFPGTFAAAAGDLDADGDQDVVLGSTFNEWEKLGSASAVWLENDGKQTFRMHQVDDYPSHLATVDCGDLDGDGRADIVAGGLHVPRPYDRLGRVTAWLSRKPTSPKVAASRVDDAKPADAVLDDAHERRVPLVNLELLDSSTAADIRELRDQMLDGIAKGKETDARWLQLADAYLAFGFPRQAEPCYRRASQLDSDNFDIHFRWAICYERLGQTPEAIEGYRRAAEFGDSLQSAECWFGIGRGYLRQEMAEEAEEAFKQARGFAPADHQLAKLMVRSGRVQAAVPLLKDLLDRYPRALKVLQLRAQAATALGNASAAVDFHERAERATAVLDIDRDFRLLEATRDRYGLARQFRNAQRLFQSGRTVEVVRTLKSAIETEWRDEFASAAAAIQIKLGDAAEDPEKARHADEAIRILGGKIEHIGASPEVLEPLGAALWLKGDQEQAKDQWERSASMRSTKGVHLKLAFYYKTHGDVKKARWHRAKAHHVAGVDALRRNRLEDAQKLLQAASQLDRKQGHTWFYLGEIYRFLGEQAKAEAAYRECLLVDPEHVRSHHELRLILSGDDL